MLILTIISFLKIHIAAPSKLNSEFSNKSKNIYLNLIHILAQTLIKTSPVSNNSSFPQKY